MISPKWPGFEFCISIEGDFSYTGHIRDKKIILIKILFMSTSMHMCPACRIHSIYKLNSNSSINQTRIWPAHAYLHACLNWLGSLHSFMHACMHIEAFFAHDIRALIHINPGNLRVYVSALTSLNSIDLICSYVHMQNRTRVYV